MLSEDKQSADVWVLNSCTVKSPAEDHFRNEIKAGREAGKKVVVAGCVPQGVIYSLIIFYILYIWFAFFMGNCLL